MPSKYIKKEFPLKVGRKKNTPEEEKIHFSIYWRKKDIDIIGDRNKVRRICYNALNNELMRINNVKNEIKDFLSTYGVKIVKEEPEGYDELMMDDHKCVVYDGDFYYIPENCSLMDENDELLMEMLLAKYEL